MRKKRQSYLSVLTSRWRCASKEGILGSREETSEEYFVVQANITVTFPLGCKPC